MGSAALFDLQAGNAFCVIDLGGGPAQKVLKAISSKFAGRGKSRSGMPSRNSPLAISPFNHRPGLADYCRRDPARRFNPMKHSEGFLKLVNDAKSHISEMTVEETCTRMASDQNVHLIDVREDNEWEAGHAAAAKHLGKGIIERDIEAAFTDKLTELILYCGGGYRSALAADVLQRMGYTNVWSMAGGWKAWKEAGAPVEGD